MIGRPNVGKSTLVNRVLGRREAVVEDVPGVTRDRVAYDAEWAGPGVHRGRHRRLEPDARGMAARIAAAAELAVEAADVVLLVVDATVGVTEIDAAVGRVLQRSGRPVVLAANKVDSAHAEPDVAALWALGVGRAVARQRAARPGERRPARRARRRAARDPGSRRRRTGPAPGGADRDARTSASPACSTSWPAPSARSSTPTAGTTRDPVDSLVDIDGTTWRFVDTAGLRRRVHEATGAEYYSSLRTTAAIDAAEVVLLLLDASEPISDQDLRVADRVVEAGRALVVVMNKWDLRR